MIQTVHLFPKLDELLFSLLRDLEPADWQRPTLAPQWRVKDIVAHLLDGNIRTLSLSRDGHKLQPSGPIESYASLVEFLDALNADWVKAAERVSPQMLITLLEATAPAYQQHLASLDPEQNAIFSVAWAGETVSKNWFHVAREYTEKMHHQLQIREATNRPMDPSRELFYPFLDTLMQALPWHYREVVAGKGTMIRFIISTELGGEWNLLKTDGGWKLVSGDKDHHPATTIKIDPHSAWKMMTKGISRDLARNASEITGDEQYALPFFGMLSVMA